MKLQLSPIASDIIICLYACITLFIRFTLESNTPISVGHSLAIGTSFLVIVWALIKIKVLNPNWFGLFQPKSNKKST